MRVVVLVPFRSTRRASHNGNGAARGTVHSLENRLDEAVGLARAIQLEVCAAELVPLSQLKPATLFGSGRSRS